MTTPHYMPGTVPADLEETADYPPLPSAAEPAPASGPAGAPHADTWVMPKLAAEAASASAPAPALDDILRPYLEESARLRQELVAAAADRDELRMQADSHGANVRELETRLQDEAERRAQVACELAERDRRIAEITKELDARAGQLRSTDAERGALHTRLESLQAELTTHTQRQERQAASQTDVERERARRESALARSQDDLIELQRRVAGHNEALRNLEGRHQIFDSMLREREALLDERDARLREAAADQQRAAAELAAALARATEAERLLAQRLAPEPPPPAPVVAPPANPELPGQIAALEAPELALPPEAGAEPAVEVAPPVSVAPPTVQAGARLLVRTAGAAGIVHVLGRRTTIGRTPDNDLRIEADFISRHHAVVLVGVERTVVEDLNSTNGVFVNDVKVARQELREGDLLTIGQTSFRYVVKPEIDQD